MAPRLLRAAAARSLHLLRLEGPILEPKLWQAATALALLEQLPAFVLLLLAWLTGLGCPPAYSLQTLQYQQELAAE